MPDDQSEPVYVTLGFFGSNEDPYIIGSNARAGWFFSVRNSSTLSDSVAIVSSHIMSVKLSIPSSSFAVLLRAGSHVVLELLGHQTILCMRLRLNKLLRRDEVAPMSHKAGGLHSASR